MLAEKFWPVELSLEPRVSSKTTVMLVFSGMTMDFGAAGAAFEAEDGAEESEALSELAAWSADF